MGVFDDKKFEELDWISQATEPIESEINEVLSILPDELTIDFELYTALCKNKYSTSITIGTTITYLVNNSLNNMPKDLHHQDLNILHDCFEFQMSPEVYLDYEEQAIVGEIKFIKVVFTVDERVLEKSIGARTIETVNYINLEGSGLGRANEIMEMLGGCEVGIRSRSPYGKARDLRNRIREIFRTNEWKIKDTRLANKVGEWIRAYIVDGDLLALSNFARLKVMTHKGHAIYSMEELK